ncbi:MAG: hypothetical protein ACFE8L_10680, partial [Candidatus Hodarchaeota archaeon]
DYYSAQGGKDIDDDGIGDTPYNISGSAGSQDNYPIWWDGPTLSIIEPQPFEVFGIMAPNFNISIIEIVPDIIWYTVDGGVTNYTCATIGTVNQTAWNYLQHGSVTLTFYTNDSTGFIWSSTVMISKDKAPQITINYPEPNLLFGIQAPVFDVIIDDVSVHTKWYSFNNIKNITFTTETQFNQTEWDKVGNGTVLIRFYANDTFGNINFTEVVVRKDAYIPDIIINSPLDDEKFGKTAPDYNLTIIEEDLATTWYTIEGIAGTFPFSGLIGSINQDAWDDAPKGEITITFYAIDNAGNIGSESVIVIKRIPSKPVIQIIIVISAISAGAVIGVAGIFWYLRRRKETP